MASQFPGPYPDGEQLLLALVLLTSDQGVASAFHTTTYLAAFHL